MNIIMLTVDYAIQLSTMLNVIIGNCDICVKQKILVTKQMKRDKILLKPIV